MKERCKSQYKERCDILSLWVMAVRLKRFVAKISDKTITFSL
jgi:hypothetical protein